MIIKLNGSTKIALGPTGLSKTIWDSYVNLCKVVYDEVGYFEISSSSCLMITLVCKFIILLRYLLIPSFVLFYLIDFQQNVGHP